MELFGPAELATFVSLFEEHPLQFDCPATLSRAAPDEVVVSSRDLPECLTSGADTEDALGAAADALEEGAGRTHRRR